MKHFIYSIAACCVLLGSQLSADAAIVTINETFDLNNMNPPSSGISNTDTPLQGGPVTLSVGDVITLNVDFLGTQKLSLTGVDGFGINSTFFAALGAAPGAELGTFTVNNASIQFVDYQGDPGNGPLLNIGTLSSNAGHIGPHMQLNVGETIEFSGYTSTFTVAALPNGVGSNQYSDLFFAIHDMDAAILAPAAVPEPGSMAMLALCGLGGFGYRRRKRQNAEISPGAA